MQHVYRNSPVKNEVSWPSDPALSQRSISDLGAMVVNGRKPSASPGVETDIRCT